MRKVANIVCSAGGKLMLGFLLVCCVDFVSAQNDSPFSGGTHYSNGLSVSSFNNDHVSGQAGNSRYSGLSGGRTTFDPGYQLSGGVPKSIIDNPFFAEQGRNPYDENGLMSNQVRGGRPGHDTQLPLGDPIVPLMLMLLGYTVWKITKKTRLS